MLQSKTIKLRLIEESDAEFVLSLRLDDKFNTFLSQVDSNLAAQQKWINKYKNDEIAGKQFYFIIERLDGTPCGTVRIYDLKEDSFCWGSWILNENKTKFSAIESALLVYEFGFTKLNYSKSHFDVMKDNTKVINFHLKMGAIKTNEDNEHNYYIIDKEAIEKQRNKYQRFLK